MSEPTQKRQFNYEAFIEELRPLLKEGEQILAAGGNHEEEWFRTWRIRVMDLLNRITALQYKVTCGIKTRYFGAADSGKRSYELFEVGMGDTNAELELLISNFDKYGDPKGVRPTSPVRRILVAASADDEEEVERLRSEVQSLTSRLVTAEMKAGELVAVQTQSVMNRLAVPERMTIPWVIKNVHFPQIGTVLAATFAAGFAVGNWAPIAAWVAKLLA